MHLATGEKSGGSRKALVTKNRISAPLESYPREKSGGSRKALVTSGGLSLASGLCPWEKSGGSRKALVTPIDSPYPYSAPSWEKSGGSRKALVTVTRPYCYGNGLASGEKRRKPKGIGDPSVSHRACHHAWREKSGGSRKALVTTPFRTLRTIFCQGRKAAEAERHW